MIIFLGINHIIVNVALFLAVRPFLPLGNTKVLLILFFVALGAIMADIDTPKSILGRIFFFISCTMKHRGKTHTWWAALLFALPILIYSTTLFVVFAISYLLHLVQDNLKMKTGAPEEWFISLLALSYILLR